MSVELLPWAEKYRPNNLNQIVYHNKIIDTMYHYLNNDDLPHILFYGISGTGKTSTIISFAKEYYGDDYDEMTLVLNSSEERGIDTVRNKIKQFALTKGVKTKKYKLVVLDEIDEMTADAQAILRKIIEKYINSVRFCFICNYLKKINIAIQSRCVVFRFNPISYNCIYEYVLSISEKENITITNNAINLIIKKSNGDMRKLLNIIQSLWMYKYNYDQNQNLNLTQNSIEQSNNKINKTSRANKFNKFDKNDNTTEKIETTGIVIYEKYVSKLLSCATSKDIINILKYVQSHNLFESYTYLNTIIDNNMLLTEIILFVYDFIIDSIIKNDNSVINYKIEKLTKIIQNLSVIYNNLSCCNNQDIQLYSFVAVFYI